MKNPYSFIYDIYYTYTVPQETHWIEWSNKTRRCNFYDKRTNTFIAFIIEVFIWRLSEFLKLLVITSAWFNKN